MIVMVMLGGKSDLVREGVMMMMMVVMCRREK